MKNKSILVACSALDYILIDKILSRDFLLDRAHSREEIIACRKSKTYHLLLMDVSFLLPDFEVLAGINGRIPVVALSSEPSDARNEEIRQAGCCACYIRPIRKELFGTFVTYWINQFKR